MGCRRVAEDPVDGTQRPRYHCGFHRVCRFRWAGPSPCASGVLIVRVDRILILVLGPGSWLGPGRLAERAGLKSYFDQAIMAM